MTYLDDPAYRSLVAACAAKPDDDLPRLVLADWLDERGEPHGELIRVQLEIAKWELVSKFATKGKRTRSKQAAGENAARHLSPLWDREKAAFNRMIPLHLIFGTGLAAYQFAASRMDFRRGLIERTECSLSDWLRWHAAVRAVTALRDVTLATGAGDFVEFLRLSPAGRNAMGRPPDAEMIREALLPHIAGLRNVAVEIDVESEVEPQAYEFTAKGPPRIEVRLVNRRPNRSMTTVRAQLDGRHEGGGYSAQLGQSVHTSDGRQGVLMSEVDAYGFADVALAGTFDFGSIPSVSWQPIADRVRGGSLGPIIGTGQLRHSLETSFGEIRLPISEPRRMFISRPD